MDAISPARRPHYLVRDLRDVLYVELDEHDNEHFNPDREWNSETLESIGCILDRYDLIPEEGAPYS
jgi:hypothetical protein